MSTAEAPRKRSGWGIAKKLKGVVSFLSTHDDQPPPVEREAPLNPNAGRYGPPATSSSKLTRAKSMGVLREQSMRISSRQLSVNQEGSEEKEEGGVRASTSHTAAAPESLAPVLLSPGNQQQRQQQQHQQFSQPGAFTVPDPFLSDPPVSQHFGTTLRSEDRASFYPVAPSYRSPLPPSTTGCGELVSLGIPQGSGRSGSQGGERSGEDDVVVHLKTSSRQYSPLDNSAINAPTLSNHTILVPTRKALLQRPPAPATVPVAPIPTPVVVQEDAREVEVQPALPILVAEEPLRTEQKQQIYQPPPLLSPTSPPLVAEEEKQNPKRAPPTRMPPPKRGMVPKEEPKESSTATPASSTALAPTTDALAGDAKGDLATVSFITRATSYELPMRRPSSSSSSSSSSSPSSPSPPLSPPSNSSVEDSEGVVVIPFITRGSSSVFGGSSSRRVHSQDPPPPAAAPSSSGNVAVARTPPLVLKSPHTPPPAATSTPPSHMGAAPQFGALMPRSQSPGRSQPHTLFPSPRVALNEGIAEPFNLPSLTSSSPPSVLPALTSRASSPSHHQRRAPSSSRAVTFSPVVHVKLDEPVPWRPPPFSSPIPSTPPSPRNRTAASTGRSGLKSGSPSLISALAASRVALSPTTPPLPPPPPPSAPIPPAKPSTPRPTTPSPFAVVFNSGGGRGSGNGGGIPTRSTTPTVDLSTLSPLGLAAAAAREEFSPSMAASTRRASSPSAYHNTPSNPLASYGFFLEAEE